MEKAIVDAVATAEKSVVAIARVRKERPGEMLNIEFRPDPFGSRRLVPLMPLNPTDPEFVPTDYASGVVVDRRGLVLTVYHALGDDCDYFVSTTSRKVFRARVVGADPRSDLAVLAPDEAALPRGASLDLPPIALGDSDALRKGQIVVALGNPFAVGRDGQASASWGIVANLGRKLPTSVDDAGVPDKSTIHHFGTLIQTDAKLNLGTSGGPLLNLRGQMIGMVTAIAATPGFETPAGYAIPVDRTFCRALELLKSGREVEYGFLGIQLHNLSMDEVLRDRQGARVERVIAGLPAAQRGIKNGDLVTKVNGVSILDADRFVVEVGKLPIDATVHLDVVRGERRFGVDVELAKYHVRGKKIVTSPSDAWRGIRVDHVTGLLDSSALASSVGGAVSMDGVGIAEVSKDSVGWSSGLRVGMRITHVDGVAVHSPKEFWSAVAKRPGEVGIRMVGRSGENTVVSVP
jgi:S1-C subfamily serine protease